MSEPTTTTDDTGQDQIAAQLRDLVGPGGNQEIIDALLEEDAATVAEEALKLLLKIGSVARAADVDLDVLLAGDRPKSGRDRLAERLRTSPTHQDYLRQGSAT
jgi:hypothetical protein